MRGLLKIVAAVAMLISVQCKRTRTNILMLSSISDPRTFNIIVAEETSSTEILGDIFESLVRFNPFTFEYEPYLAESWDNKELEWRFFLRDGVTWSDGVLLTAEDVKFTFDVIMHPDVPTSLKDIIRIGGKFPEIKVVSKREIIFKLPEPFAPFLSSIGGISIIPKHILASFLEEGNFSNAWNINTLPSLIVGTGHFVLDRYVQSQFVILRKNTRYWQSEDGRRLPYLDGKIRVIVPNQDAQYIRFTRGEIDIYYPRPEDVEKMKKIEGVVLENLGVSLGIDFLAFNLNPINPKSRWFTEGFRRAIAHAIDKKSMLKNVFLGLGRPAVSFISPQNKVFAETLLSDYGYNPKISKEILKKEGFRYKDGRLYASNAPVEVSLFTNSGNEIREKICAMLVQDLEAIGIKVHFKPLEFNTLVEKLLITRDWDMVVIGLTGTVDPHNGANFYRSSGRLHLWNPQQKKPATDWEREIDRLVELGAKEMNMRKRPKYYKRIQRILHKKLPIIPLIRPYVFVAYRENIKGFRPTVFGVYRDELIRKVALTR